MTSYYESFDGSAVDLSWSAVRDNVPWTLPGDGTGAINNAAGNTYQRMNGDLGSTDHYSEVLLPRVWANNSSGDPRVVLLLRADPSAQTYYACSLQLTNAIMTFLLWTNGSAAPFGAVTNESVDLSGDGPLRFRFECEGSAFRGYLNDVLVKTETSTGRTAGTLGGTGGQRTDTIRWAEFRAGALGDPPAGHSGRQLIAA